MARLMPTNRIPSSRCSSKQMSLEYKEKRLSQNGASCRLLISTSSPTLVFLGVWLIAPPLPEEGRGVSLRIERNWFTSTPTILFALSHWGCRDLGNRTVWRPSLKIVCSRMISFTSRKGICAPLSFIMTK